jgi:ribosomal protein S18 acetylase RimI-like enzyme
MAEEVPVTPVSIRRATGSDAPALLDMAARMAGFPLPPWRAAAEVIDADGRDMVQAVHTAGPNHDVFVAEVDGTPAGCLYVLVTTDFFGRPHAHVSVIATTAAAEGTGVGRALIAHAEGWARQRRLTLLTLNVFASNTRARRFYERAGFDVEMVKYAKPLE